MGGKTTYAQVKEWRARNKDKVSAQARRYRAKHPDAVKAVRDAYRERSRDERLPREAAKARARRANDPEGQRRRQLAWRARREEKLAAIAGRPRQSVCELCAEPSGTVFDHDHATGEFRGWICDRCNKVLGLMRDDAKLLRKLADYLENSDVKVDSQGAK